MVWGLVVWEEDEEDTTLASQGDPSLCSSSADYLSFFLFLVYV